MNARPTADDRIRAALWFAGHGFGIFSVWSASASGTCRCPAGADCSSPGKHPVTAHGFQDATRDPDRIRTLLSAGSDPNYGLVCPEGVFALDVDADDDGIARLARLEALYGELPPTLRTQTANGQHVFLRWPVDRPRPLRKMFGYVTRWGSGRQAGYVIGPRSIHHSGAVYSPVGTVLEIADVPPRWAAAAVEGEDSPTITVGGELPHVGGRHDWLRDRARYFRGFMDNKDALRAALLVENDRFEVPKTAAEVERAIGDVFEKFPLDAPEVIEEKITRRLGEDDLGLLSRRAFGEFPAPPVERAFEGLLGNLVLEIAPGTDASLTGLLGALVAFCGALVPGTAYFHGDQTSSPFIALVGESGIGRKGTAMRRIRDALATTIEPVYVNRVILDGVNSGEGLVTALNYKQEAFQYEPTVGLLYEEEYATLMAARGRDGSTLDSRMRQAFDGGPLSNRRSDQTKTVNPPYWLPALVAITPDELRTRLEAGALQSGSANRWLYLAVIKRDSSPTNMVPELSDETREGLVAARRKAVDGKLRLGVEQRVTDTLSEYESFMRRASDGVSGDLTRRLAVIAFRVALVHALVERSATVTVEHMNRALALTEYGREGIPWIFGETIGSPDADLLFRHLQDRGRLTKREITQGIIRDPLRRQAAIDELVRLGQADVATIHTTGGRPRTELISTAKTRGFVHFVQGSDSPTPPNRPAVAQNPDFERETAAQNSHKTAQKADTVAQNSHETAQNSALVCHYYREHQSSHRLTEAGWICDICAPEPVQ